jgi:ribonuclease P protein component
MLARGQRLRRPKDIARVYQRGTRGGGPDFFVKAWPSLGSTTRATIVVSRKVDKRAVVRNRIRRRLSGALEQLWQTLPPGYDIVITVTRDLTGLSSGDLHTQLERALRQSGAIQPTKRDTSS